jgi:hypothetical protein
MGERWDILRITDIELTHNPRATSNTGAGEPQLIEFEMPLTASHGGALREPRQA